MPYSMTQADYAKHRGITPTRIAKIVKDGKLKGAIRRKLGRAYIDPVKADALLEKNLDPMFSSENNNAKSAAKKKAKSKGESTRRSKPLQRVRPKKDLTNKEKKAAVRSAGIETVDYHGARTLNEQYKAALRKLEYQQKSGELVPAEEVKSAAFDTARKVRDAILNIPDRIGPQLTAETDLYRVISLLTEELQQALEALSKR